MSSNPRVAATAMISSKGWSRSAVAVYRVKAIALDADTADREAILKKRNSARITRQAEPRPAIATSEQSSDEN